MLNLAKHLTLLTIVLMVASCASSPRNKEVDQNWVYTEGTGNDCADALKQAKLLAEDSVTGSFLDSRRTLKNDRDYSERVDEFGGGVIRKYEVLETKAGTPCQIKIRAQVDPVQSNFADSGSGVSFDLKEMVGLVNRQDQAKQMLDSLINRPEMFSVRLNQLSILSDGSGQVRVGYDVTSIAVAKKWYSDLEGFFSVQGKPFVFKSTATMGAFAENLATIAVSPAIIAWAIVSSPFATPDNSKNEINLDQTICFWKHNDKSTVNCYESWLAADARNRLYRINLWQTVGSQINDASPKALIGSFSMVSNTELPAVYKSGGNRQQNLPIVAPDVGFRVNQQLPKQVFSGDAKLHVSVGFVK